MDKTNEVTVGLKAHDNPLISRAFDILKDRIQQRRRGAGVRASSRWGMVRLHGPQKMGLWAGVFRCFTRAPTLPSPTWERGYNSRS